MSEIKSTLDLVMERTKNLTLSEEEKEGQKNADLKKQLAGLMQKYQDQALKQTELTNHLDGLKNTYGHGAGKRMADEILSHVDVEVDNDRRLSVLAEYFGLEMSSLKIILVKFEQARQKGESNRIDRLKSRLSKNYEISGSAVIPNIETDPDWRKEQNAIIKRFQIQLETEKKRLTSR